MRRNRHGHVGAVALDATSCGPADLTAASAFLVVDGEERFRLDVAIDLPLRLGVVRYSEWLRRT